MGAGAGFLILASAHASYLTSSKSRSFVSRFSPKEVERRRSHSSPGPEESRKVTVLTSLLASWKAVLLAASREAILPFPHPPPSVFVIKTLLWRHRVRLSPKSQTPKPSGARQGKSAEPDTVSQSCASTWSRSHPKTPRPWGLTRPICFLRPFIASGQFAMSE